MTTVASGLEVSLAMSQIELDLNVVMPEILMAIFGMLLLVFGVIRGKNSLRLVSYGSAIAMVFVAYMVLNLPVEQENAFQGLFVNEWFSSFMKVLILMGSVISIFLSLNYLENNNMNRFEFPILILFSTLGMMIMLSANDLMTLYMGLELQSLPLYILAAFKRDNLKSSEAGIKYFVLGALSSGLLLYGISLIYGFTGTTSFETLSQTFASDENISIAVIVGLVFIISGLIFKISAVPFHMWTPDVYEGSPTATTAFFAIVPKIAAMGLIIRILFGAFADLIEQWQQIIVLVSILSMLVGAFAGIVQDNIKRLMAYSSIGHIGYALVGVAAGSIDGVRGVIIYLTIYMIMSAGVFAVILSMKKNDRMVENISDLSGISKSNPAMALLMTILMFSMAGIPPVAGFFGKLFIFQAAVESGLYTLAVIGVLTSVVAAFYYLRIIKVMYFDAFEDKFDKIQGKSLATIMTISGIFALCFIISPDILFSTASEAAQSLWAE